MTLGDVARFQKSEAAFLHLDVVLEVLLLQNAVAGLRDVNLDVQISWQAQHGP